MNPSNLIAILKVAIGLGAVIFVHELGHFLVAKMCGVKCDKFYVGFDVPIKLFGQTIIPAKLVHFQWGETEYGIGAIPLGGYVKMMGQDDNPGNIEEQIKESMVDGESTESAMLPSGLVDRTKIHPRSYLAKSVIQRMMIISAGVIFNLLFAILFATFAFKSGVNYEPPVVGNVIGGGPAWKHDLAGAQIEKINDNSTEGYFPYVAMAEQIVFGASEGPVELTYRAYGSDDFKTIQIDGERGISRQMSDLPLIGVTSSLSPVVSKIGTLEGDPADAAVPAFEPGDRIVEMNGTKINTAIDLRNVLVRDADEAVTYVFERETDGETKTISTEVAPKPAITLGFGVEWLPVADIKTGSPAEGILEPGDEIIAINGQPRGDLLTLDQRLVPVAKDEGTVELTIKRAGKESTVTLSPVVPLTISDVGPNRAQAVDTLGIALPISLNIESVDAGGPAYAAGLKPGDNLVSFEYLLTDEQKKNERYDGLNETVDFVDDKTSWAEVHRIFQMLPAGTEIKLTYKRGDLQQTATMKLSPSDKYFQHKRGIGLNVFQRHYKSDTWSDAMKYGTLQVGKDMTRVGKTLGKLVRGKISPKNLGGPGTIAMVATSEASEGTSRLLLFLTFLSANLAIINFLPIPILDGGHMVFLAYEGIFRRPVSERVQMVLTYAGLIMILGLMVFVISLDVGRISSLFF